MTLTYSASWMTRALLEHVVIDPRNTTVLEPCCGEGAISNALEQLWLHRHNERHQSSDSKPTTLDYLATGLASMATWIG